MAELLQDVGCVRVTLSGMRLSCRQMAIDKRNGCVVDDKSRRNSTLTKQSERTTRVNYVNSAMLEKTHEMKSMRYLVSVVSFQTSLDHVDMSPLAADVLPLLIAYKDAAEKTNKVGALQQLEVNAHWCIEFPNLGGQIDLPAFILLGDRFRLRPFRSLQQ